MLKNENTQNVSTSIAYGSKIYLIPTHVYNKTTANDLKFLKTTANDLKFSDSEILSTIFDDISVTYKTLFTILQIIKFVIFQPIDKMATYIIWISIFFIIL